MKREKIKFFILAAFLLLSSSVFAEDIGRFTSLEGNVDVFRMGRGEATPAAEGQGIFVGDVVRTKRASKAEITFADNTIIRLADDTRVEIKEYQLDQKKKRINAVINVDRGKIRAIVSKVNGKADFTINTPNASGNVKGTDVIVFYQKSSTGVVVVDGKFSAFNLAHPDKVVTVTSGNVSVIPPEEPPQTPRTYLAMEMERHEADTKVIAKRKEAMKAEGYEEPGQMKATVVKVAGDVRIRSRGAISWHDAKAGEILGAGDEIETKEDGKIEIKLDNNNAINLKPNSQLILHKLIQDLQTCDYENLLESNIGKIRAKVEKIKGNSKFEIKTPTAVAAVKGTILYLNILPNLTAAYFEGGNGTLNNIISGITKVVADGNSSSADNQGNTSEPSPPSDEEKSQWTEGWEAEGGGEGYSPPGGEGEGTEEEAGGGAPDTGAGSGGGDSYVPFTENYGPGGGSPPGGGPPPGGETPGTALTGTASGNFGNFGSFNVDEESSFDAAFSAATTVAPWSGTAPTIATGTYSNPNAQLLWWGDVTGTGDDGGTFEGWTGGSWHSWEGVVSSIYIDPSGMAGNLFGYMSGTNSDGILGGSGDLFVIPMGETDVSPENLSDSLIEGSGGGELYVAFNNGAGYFDAEFDREMKKIEGENWGIWREIYSAEYDNPNGLANWVGVAGGYYNEEGYFFSAIEGIDNLIDSLRMDIIGAYLDYYKLGAYYGTILGTYTPWDFYYFEGVGLGAFIEEPLTSSGYLSNSIRYYGDWSGYFDGLIGVVGSLWGDSPSTLVSIGDFYSYENEPFIWFSGGDTLYSYDNDNETYTTYDGGAFYGATSGIGDDNLLEGLTRALYIDPEGNAGILSGNLTGAYSNDIGMYLLEGSLTRTPMTQVGIPPENLYDSIWYGGGGGSLAGSFLTGGNIESDESLTTMSIVDFQNEIAEPWGIYYQIFSSTFSNPNGDTTWSGIAGGNDSFGAYNPTMYHYGQYDYYVDDSYNGNYYYNYYANNTYGYLSYYRYDGTHYYKYYNTDGTYSGYNYQTGASINGTWDPSTQLLSDIVTTPPDSGNAYFSYEYSYGTANSDNGYWLADITNGVWDDITAELHGRFITYTKMGTLDGDILGVYDNEEGIWQGVGAGVWEGEPLNFVSQVEANLSTPTMYYYGNYYYDPPWAQYNYYYYGNNRQGYQYYYNSSPWYYTYTYYSSDGSTYTYLSNYGSSYSNWNTSTPLSGLVNTPPGGYYAYYPGNYPTSYSDGNLSGLLGGTQSLWSSETPFTFIGEYSGSPDLAHTWNTELYSYNYLNDTYTTYDGGAYYGFIGGTHQNPITGKIVALYIDPDGNAGYLRGNLAGTSYPQIGMFEADGTLTTRQVVSDIGIAPEELHNSIWGSEGDGMLSGSFVSGGNIAGNENLNTMNIVDFSNETEQPWGIYSQEITGTFSNPSGDTTWSGMIGGNDSFGVYNPTIYTYGQYYGYIADSLDGYYYYNYYANNSGGSAYRYDRYWNYRYYINYNSDGTYSGWNYINGTPINGTWDPQTESLSQKVKTPPVFETATFTPSYEDSYGAGNNDNGYWIADITNGVWDSISAQLHGDFLTKTKMGTIDGDILGVYNTAESVWQAVGLGTWEGEPLTLSGYWGQENTSLYNNEGDGYVSWAGEEYGLIGSTTVQWWNSVSFPILAMGEYYVSESAEEPFIWNTPIQSYNAPQDNYTTLDGGAFWGYTGGIWNNGEMDGAVAALYMDPNGNAGILRGDVSGNYYPSIEMWMAEGILTPTQMAQDLGISPEDLEDYKDSGYLDAYVYGDFLGDGEIEGLVAYNYDYGYYYGDTYFIVDDDGNSQNWGIYDLKLGDENYYDDKPEGSELFMADISGGGQFGYNNSQGIMRGDVFGVYDGPDQYGDGTWIATSIGTWNEYTPGEDNTYNDGEYYGFIGGLWDNEAIIGKMVALYWQPSGAEIDYDGAPFFGSGLAGFSDIGNLAIDDIDGIDPDIGQPWGIWKFDVAGDYDANTPAPFKLTVGGGPNEEGYWLGIIAGIEKPESDIILGAFRGIWLDAEEIHGGLYRGDVFGSIDTDTWEGVGLGEWQTQAWEEDGVFIPPSSLNNFLTNYIDSEPIIGLGTGNFEGGGNIGTFVSGDNFSLDEQNWGIYYLSLGGEYNNLDIRKIWSGVVGGSDIDAEGKAYWLVHTSGIWEDNEISGIARGTVLSDTNLGSIEGDIFGLYNESGVGSGTWDAIAVGSWNEEPLKFVSNVENFYSDVEYGTFFNFSFDDNGEPVFEEIGAINGLLGSTQSLWTGSASTVFIGEYSLDDETSSHLWGADVYSHNYENGTDTTYDGGAYYGTILGIHQNPIEGMLIAFYMDPDGNAGYISGNLDGETYSELGMFEMDGTLTTKQMAEDVFDTLTEFLDAEIDEGLIVGSGLGNFEGGGTIDGALGGVILSLAEQDWGIWMAVSAGEWSGPTSPWNLALGGVSLDEGAEVDGYWLGTVKGAGWSNGSFEGDFKGVFFGPNFDGAVLTSFDAGSVTGDVIGVYDEVDTTWQAVSAGEWVELAELDPGILGFNNEALAAMVDVPITETYASLLQGTGVFDAGGSITGAMDISFYTSAAQDLSGIWAALISGNYTGPTSDNWTLPLTDSAGTSATLTGTQWSDGQWLANVSGTAPDSVTFTGQAGGTYAGTDAGTFMGVGAGTWEQTPPGP